MDRHNCTDTMSGAALSSALSLSWHGWLNDGRKLMLRELKRAMVIVKAWRHRRCVRRDLQRLDERLLRDIGLTPAQARREIEKPLWRSK